MNTLTTLGASVATATKGGDTNVEISIMADKPANLIGGRVRWMRESLKLTQDELAGRLAKYGVQLDYVKIGQVENGKRRVIDWELVGFAKALGVSVTWLLSGQEDYF